MSAKTPKITAFVGPNVSGRTSQLRQFIDSSTLVIAFAQRQKALLEAEHPKAAVATMSDLIHDAYVARHPQAARRIGVDGLTLRLRANEHRFAGEFFTQLLGRAMTAYRHDSRPELLEFVEMNAHAVQSVLDELGISFPEFEATLLAGDTGDDPDVWSLLPEAERIVVDDLQEYPIDQVELLLNWVEETGTELAVAANPEVTIYDFIGASPRGTMDRLRQAGANIVRTTAGDSAAVRTVTTQSELEQFITDAAAAGKSIAVLTPLRRLAAEQIRLLTDALPGLSIVSALPELSYEISIVYTNVISRWSHIEQLDPHEALDEVTTLALAPRRPSENPARPAEAWGEVPSYARPRVDALLKRFDAGKLDAEGFFQQMRVALSEAELEANADRSEKIRASAAQILDGDVVVSTVHGALGRRFDAVALVQNDRSSGIETWTEYGLSRADTEALLFTPQRWRF